ncbi:hypothetical protein HDV63DRAFT_208095 [Trichoderma sp. SZMC 28014]
MNGALVVLFSTFSSLLIFLSLREVFLFFFLYVFLFKPVASISPGQGSCFYARSDIPRFMHTNPACLPEVMVLIINESLRERWRGRLHHFYHVAFWRLQWTRVYWCALHFLDVMPVWED